MSPVDFAYAGHKDGSASITVGNIDRVYGMEWSVELTLRPGSTVLEQRVTLSNRSDVRHRFYWWNNRSEEHTSELQSQSNLVCRLLLEKKKKHYRKQTTN